ncbi:type II toxin-antitoxin system VapC family toxin [Moheibacter sp.]|uniref:type II toxin-antitoxin system VapC family toxin n=1 Tax=Moheibacter sp. TaxID=1965316 RepID=UPI003C78F861
MNYLIDTHVVLWFITNDEKLPDSIKEIIGNKENQCFISIASYWEIGIKTSIGRLELNADLESIFKIIENSGFDALPITQQHILKNSTLNFHHQDPFDRILIAQALSEDLTIISKDNLFKKYEVSLIWETD